MFLMRIRLIVIISLAVSFSGCAKLAHLQELLTIKGYSDEKDAQEKYVKTQDAKFAKLLAAVDDGTIVRYTTRAKLQKAFGDPVYSHSVNENGVACEEELYRYSLGYFDSAKVYFYFDAKGKVLNWKYIPAPKPEENNNAKEDIPGEKSEGNKSCAVN